MAGGEPRRAAVTRQLRTGLLIAAAVFILDQAIKLWLVFVFDLGARGIVRVTPFFDLVLTWNAGISYGLFQQDGPLGQGLLIAFKVVAVVVLVIWLARGQFGPGAAGLGLIIGGALGNLADPFVYGRNAVADYALLHVEIAGRTWNWYVFNLADAAIVAGVALLLYESVRSPGAPKAP